MAAGYVAILTVELHFPEAASLKAKRLFVRSAKDNLRNRFGAAVAEVDHHDLWQRATLTVACVSRSAHEADELARTAVACSKLKACISVGRGKICTGLMDC